MDVLLGNERRDCFARGHTSQRKFLFATILALFLTRNLNKNQKGVGGVNAINRTFTNLGMKSRI